MNSCFPSLSIASTILVSSMGASDAAVLLIVDLSVANQVTITATDGLSDVSTTDEDLTGVYFENFYGGAGGSLTNVLITGDLTNSGNPADFTPALFRDNGGTDPGLNLFSWSVDSIVTFTAGSLAFEGSATWGLSSAEYTDMKNGNTSGNLYFAADNLADLPVATIIGTYEVIPEPSSTLLLGLGALACFGRRRQR